MKVCEYLIPDDAYLGHIEFSIAEDRGMHRLTGLRLFDARGPLLQEATNIVELNQVELQRVDITPDELIVSAKVHAFKTIPTQI